ncbi:serine/threonine-protein kinase pim-2-like [Odontesthes bonariensis]|uniref:serine/threonine-protein kinase pim-2-like n=1 Tax=Odontesthes bonariensis TaxID=219752 RepID=UPI003F583709
MGINSKTQRKNTGVAESSSKTTQSLQIVSDATGPSINKSEVVSVRKRRADDEEQRPSKKMRHELITTTEHSEDVVEVPVETRTSNTSIPCERKRKADYDGESPKKRSRRENMNTSEPPAMKVENDSAETENRKARSNEDTISSTSSSTSSTEFSGSIAWIYREGDEKIRVFKHIFNNVSHEEENIYKMSSMAKTSRAHFEGKYLELQPIGEGGFGCVYSGFRKADVLPVAIKHIKSDDLTVTQVLCNGKAYSIILEVALMLKAAGAPKKDEQSAVVSLFDWYILDDELILIMEIPPISEDLYKYRKMKGALSEKEAKMIMRQLVDAAVDMHSKGVFHRDIKLQNVLLESVCGDKRVRLIDFGCGHFHTDQPFRNFCGTRAYFPPEYFDRGTYQACPTTVWQLGALFYSLLGGHGGFKTSDFIHDKIHINPMLSTDCKQLLKMCLTRDPAKRATLEELQSCPTLRQTSHRTTQHYLNR